ncbi:GTPase IMAP family member 8-like isoform X1 [Paramormyrops kingsleyae]|uniref:GTPase IMAP family member 8-like isoform X1 n=1 Tax=Paramormyrops kingsleyae TaxID=1676925 RepID=UPI003B97C5B4
MVNTVALVLLGRRGSGKSCCGNTILGRKGFQSILSTKPVTTKCEKQTESIQGRQITVIDTPDFFDDSLPHRKHHIDTCRSLVSEGPCVYLLVLQLGRFTEGEKNLVEQTERVFGRAVTRRMIILFSYGDDLEGITIQDFLKNAQTELKALVEKCGNRYHVFNNRDTSNRRQVTELLNMVDVMLDRGKGGPVTQTPQLSVKNTRYVEKQEAQDRNNDSAVWRMEIEGNDSTYRVKRKAGMREGDDGSLQKRDTIAVTLVLLGRRGSGKSCCGNTILGRKGFQSVLSTKPVTTECKKQTESIQGRQITVIDTPDFFDDPLPHRKHHIDTCRSLVAEGPCVYLLVLQLGRFTEGEKKIVEQTEGVFGRAVTRRMIILFSYGDDLEGITIQDFLMNAQTELKALVKKCGNRCHVFNNRDTSNRRQVTELLNMVNGMLDRGDKKNAGMTKADNETGMPRREYNTGVRERDLEAQVSHTGATKSQHDWRDRTKAKSTSVTRGKYRDEDKERTTMCECVLL